MTAKVQTTALLRGRVIQAAMPFLGTYGPGRFAAHERMPGVFHWLTADCYSVMVGHFTRYTAWVCDSGLPFAWLDRDQNPYITASTIRAEDAQ